jgi:hypothetical protein
MSLRYFVQAICNECGKEVTADYLPDGWVTSPIGEDTHFCSEECMQKSVKRITTDAFEMVFGKVLTQKEFNTLKKATEK